MDNEKYVSLWIAKYVDDGVGDKSHNSSYYIHTYTSDVSKSFCGKTSKKIGAVPLSGYMTD